MPIRGTRALCLAVLFAAGFAAPLQAEGRPATHPALRDAALPPLIPVETFFADRTEQWDHRLSPDGRQLLWLARKDEKVTVHYGPVDGAEVRTIAADRPVYSAYWAHDSRHITAWWDDDGDENYHFLVADTDNPAAGFRDLTPGADVKVRFQQHFPDGPSDYLLRLNRRDPAVYDLYRIDFRTGAERLIAQNPGDVGHWITDQAGDVAGRFRHLDDGDWFLEVPDAGGWREVVRGGPEDWLDPPGHPPPGSSYLWARSNLERDRAAFVKLDLASGAESVVQAHPTVDVASLWVDRRDYRPLMTWAYPGTPLLTAFDPVLEELLESFAGEGPFGLSVRSWTRDRRKLTVRVSRDRTGRSFALVDLDAGTVRELARSAAAAQSDHLADMRPISFRARDGLEIHGYLTLPRGVEPKGLPTVLRVHGGPFSRDYWGYNANDQFLANRGYAVLRVNYRGSTGYGRAFTEKAQREFAGAMHDDLIDAVDWAVRQGVSDPDKVAIFGASYGGYATLVGLTFTPKVFAAGVNIVGVADLVTLLETAPAYWKFGIPYWHRYVGDPADPADRAEMAARSPINFVDRIERPLLVAQGANDVRVIRDHSDRIVAAMRERGLDVRYIVFDDEGHAIRKGRNKIALAEAVEVFLAEHLGGRSATAGP